MSAEDRCDKCGTPKSKWDTTPCVKSLTKSQRHSVTRFHIPIPPSTPAPEES